ncbi:hypothetical protein LUZ60_009754 [Juncus effusus]|nr:hypothetical protein LUZ60_009754 [Juncus effusus]
MYPVSTGGNNDALANVVWQIVWKTSGILPKVRVFAWRLLSNALPSAFNLHKRINEINPNCEICNDSIENLSHLIFSCPRARVIWFHSPLSLFSQVNPNNLLLYFASVLPNLNIHLLQLFFALIWEIWKSRNDIIFRGKNVNYAVIINRMYRTAQLGNVFAGLNNQFQAPDQSSGDGFSPTEIKCWSDFSLDQFGKAAIAVILRDKRGQVIRVGTKTMNQTVDVLQGEFEALFFAMELVRKYAENNTCLFLTDNKEVADCMIREQQANRVQLSSWVAIQRAQDCVLYKDPTFRYISRIFNTEANSLANLSRVLQIDFDDSVVPPLVRGF